jgi:hypothetical protein
MGMALRVKLLLLQILAFLFIGQSSIVSDGISLKTLPTQKSLTLFDMGKCIVAISSP